MAERKNSRGIDLLSLEEKINTASAAGELIFHVFGAIAHFERRLIAERTKDGIAAARARGKRPGRQRLDADKIAAVLKLVQAGLSPSAAARQVGLGRSTVYRELGRAGIRTRDHAPLKLIIGAQTMEVKAKHVKDFKPGDRVRHVSRDELGTVKKSMITFMCASTSQPRRARPVEANMMSFGFPNSPAACNWWSAMLRHDRPGVALGLRFTR